MEAYPRFSGTAGIRAYVAFLGRQMTRSGTSGRLDNAIERVRADLLALTSGAGSNAVTVHDAARLQAVCTAYGVHGPG